MAERGAGQVVRLKQPPRPPSGATGPVELQRAAQAAIAAGAVQQRLILSGAGGAGLPADGQQFPHRLWQQRIVKATLYRVLLHVRQRHAVRGAQVV
ncbi:hypothetical protein [Xylella fastidiosa]|uniref:hypothetical protein n=2 Tax=Xylella fastidiosa TaxID=2371 RepID=UPI0031B9CE52